MKRSRVVTMADVGKIAGVTQVTVSRALSNPSKVSKVTMAKIQDAIERTGFVPNLLAGALSTRKSMMVSALVPSINNPTYSSMIKTLDQELGQLGYQVLLSETGHSIENEERVIATHLSRRPDAVFLTGVHHTSRARRMLLAADIPVIELWDISTTPIDICIGFSHVEAGYLAAQYARKQGYKIAATVCAPDERALLREKSFTDKFLELGGNEVIISGLDILPSLKSGRLGMKNLLDNKSFNTGVVYCSSDAMAHGVMIEAQARNLRVPEDIAIMSFGDQEFAEFTEPPLTSIKVDREELGRKAVKMMIAELSTRKNTLQVVNVGMKVIPRRSA